MSQMGLIIKQLSFYKVDSQQNQFRNNFTVVDNLREDEIKDQIERSRSPLNTVDSGFVAKQMANVIGLTGNSDKIDIIGGWKAPRFRFTMMCEYRSYSVTNVFILTGWTDHDEISVSNGQQRLDPNMILTVNGVDETVVKNGMGGMKHKTSKQLHLHKDYTLQTYRENIPLRPTDVADVLEITENITSSTSSASTLGGIDKYDILKQGLELEQNRQTNIAFSNVEDNSTTNYLAKQVETIATSITDEEFGETNMNSYSNRFSDAKHSYGIEDDARSDLLTHSLSQVSDFLNSGSFTIRQLEEMDRGNTLKNDKVVNVYLPQYGQFTSENIATTGWNGSTKEVQIASIVRNSLPNFMLFTALTHMRFLVESIGGQSAITPIPIGQGKPTIKGSEEANLFNVPAASEYNHVDVVKAFNYVKNKILTEVVPIISSNGLLDVFADVECNVRGRFTIKIKVGENKPEILTAPMFASRTTSPIVSSDQNDLYGICSTVGKMGEILGGKRIKSLNKVYSQVNRGSAMSETSQTGPSSLFGGLF